MIEARGKDKRGNGTATAIITASFAESGEQTDVEVLTDLAITGKPAQFGRGVISDVSDRLLDQFLACVSGRFTEGATEEASPSAAPTAGADTRFDEADTEQTIELETVPPSAVSDEVGTSSRADVEPPVTSAAAPAAPPASEPSRYSSRPGDSESQLDFFSTVVPVVLKRYGPALAIVGLLLFIVIKIIRRKS